jgi:hypothetical protein
MHTKDLCQFHRTVLPAFFQIVKPADEIPIFCKSGYTILPKGAKNH